MHRVKQLNLIHPINNVFFHNRNVVTKACNAISSAGILYLQGFGHFVRLVNQSLRIRIPTRSSNF